MSESVIFLFAGESCPLTVTQSVTEELAPLLHQTLATVKSKHFGNTCGILDSALSDTRYKVVLWDPYLARDSLVSVSHLLVGLRFCQVR